MGLEDTPTPGDYHGNTPLGWDVEWCDGGGVWGEVRWKECEWEWYGGNVESVGRWKEYRGVGGVRGAWKG